MRRFVCSMAAQFSAEVPDVQIRLTQSEQELFELFRAVLRRYELNTTVRVAGGWVRDKILGKDNHDIDIALDDCSGVVFAEHTKTFLADTSHKTLKIGVIQANPEQSKHLETATARVLDIDVDFVNLRAEDYTSDSRIPTIRFGTPVEDANRRDFTVNTLFYNVNKQVVEDFTGKGVNDLKQGLLRTPLEPRTTFLDDPLRVLRAVRFSSRYSFAIEAETSNGMQLAEVKDALQRKVSRERVGTEVLGMLQGAESLLICASEDGEGATPAADVTFEFGPACECAQAINALSEEELRRTSAAAASSPSQPTPAAFGDTAVAALYSPEQRTFLGLALLCLPASGWYYQYKTHWYPLAKYFVKDSLKCKSMLADMAASLIRSQDELFAVLERGIDDSDETKVAMGMIISQLREDWRLALRLAAARFMTARNAPANVAMDACDNIEQRIDSWGLSRAWEMRPLLDGKALIKTFAAKGPQVGHLMRLQQFWQFTHPSGSREECETYLRSMTS